MKGWKSYNDYKNKNKLLQNLHDYNDYKNALTESSLLQKQKLRFKICGTRIFCR